MVNMRASDARDSRFESGHPEMGPYHNGSVLHSHCSDVSSNLTGSTAIAKILKNYKMNKSNKY